MTPTGLVLLAAAEDSEYGKAAPFGLFVTLALAVAVVFLVRSMIKHLRRIPPTFDRTKAPDATPDEDGDAATTGDAAPGDATGGAAPRRTPESPAG